MYYIDKVIAFIGPACAFALQPVARLAAYWNLPIITGMGDQVSRRKHFIFKRNFTRRLINRENHRVLYEKKKKTPSVF